MNALIGLGIPTPINSQLSFPFMFDSLPIYKNSVSYKVNYIQNNLNKKNRELAKELNLNIYQLKHIMQKHNCCRTDKEVFELKSRLGKQLTGESNHNWKNGISKDGMRYKRLHPDRTKARQAVYDAVRLGKLVKQPCEACGTTEDIQAHHSSYAYEDRLKVNFLCRKDHRLIHAYLKQGLSYEEAKQKIQISKGII
jgi:hypothetical protein